MSPYQSKATSYSRRGNSLPALPQFETMLGWKVDQFDEGVGAIINATIGRPWSWFQLLNQSSSAELLDSMLQIELIPGVCGDDLSTITNCSDLCSRRSDMFGSWRTLWHCLSLASLSLADTSFPGLNESSHELIHNTLRNFSITGAGDFPGEIVLNNTFECALASCNADKGECTMKDLDAGYIVDGRFQLDVLNESLMELCEGVEVEMDADIAGPGVVISYIFQTAMAVYVWAFISLPNYLDVLNTLRSTPYPPLNWGRLFDSWPPILRSLWKNLVHATSTFLVEFHEAQCFLVISIEIALLYAKSRALTSESANWVNLSQFRTLVQLVGSTGAWSVALTQTSLRRARLNPFYNRTLSTVSLVLAIETVAKTTDPTTDEAYRLFKGLNSISECGGNTSLRSFCAPAQEFYGLILPPTTIYVSAISIITTWSFILISALTKMAWVAQMHRRLRQRSTYTLAMGFLAHLEHFMFAAFDVIMVFFLYACLISLRILQKRVGADEWGVGQVIAVLIWAPVLSKYLYLIIFGVERGFLYRLSRSFMVVKRPSETENDGEGDTAPGDQGDVAPGDEEGVAQADEGVIAPGDEEDIALSDERDIVPGDATDADNVPLIPVYRKTAAW
ncbi:uncharacterized protein NECHADRAFT_77342 [Fusarium vanettenii 77-13-4]|uniref:Uncharacterized protein n=1 Tax=Fusarium vanettenii (strain ATCC MYA-4622 / CBS 123669 / FGSC 9596 / NRRL 45880 / 77-13-4) TaxID=660122 RepID=C7YKY9_FUSV7|nr:uncharacterized protein NECHADRAFT_77342 [Fusarium vanettenii 77-13-4]EEU46703.1 hypothetical protein NECHADRAFT_77342 [Fusarium vanettenii 77-13-4]